MNRVWTWNSNSVLFEYTWKASVLPCCFSVVSVTVHCYRYYDAIVYTETPHNSGMVKRHIRVPRKMQHTKKEPEGQRLVILCYTALADTPCPERAAVSQCPNLGEAATSSQIILPGSTEGGFCWWGFFGFVWFCFPPLHGHSWVPGIVLAIRGWQGKAVLY